MRTIVIGFGGFVGAILRYHVDGWVDGRTVAGAFPWGTFVVNVSGCFVLGFLVSLLTERVVADPDLRLGLTVGFVGAYTTFSTFAYQALRLGEDGAPVTAAAYVMASVVVGIAAAWAGTVVGRGG